MNNRQIFGNYRVLTGHDGVPVELGRDSAGVTYKAARASDFEQAFLTVVPLSAIDPGALPLFQKEAAAAKELDHQNIARVFEVGSTRDSFYSATEYLEGETLEQWVNKYGRMRPEQVLGIAAQVVSALAAAAFHSVPHHSIQPANIMLLPSSAETETPQIKIFGFGMARVKPPHPETAPDGALPAYQFAAPEQLDRGAVDFRSEIYSLGCTLWFLLTGTPPFVGSPAAVTAQQMMAQPPIEELSDFPRSIRSLLDRMLQKDPHKRPQDPTRLAAEIANALGGLRRTPLSFLSGFGAVGTLFTPNAERRAALRQRLSFRRKAAAPLEVREPDFDAKPLGSFLRPLAIAAAVLLFLGVVAGVLAWKSARGGANEAQVDNSAPGEPVGVPVAGSSVQPTIVSNESAAATAATPAPSAVAAASSVPAPATASPAEVATTSSPAEEEKNAIVAADESRPGEEPAPPAEGPAEPVVAAQPEPPANTPAPVAAASEPAAAPASASTQQNDSDMEREEAPAPKRVAKAAPKKAKPRRSEPEVRRAEPADLEEAEILAQAPRPAVTRSGRMKARFVGVTPDGRWIFEGPEGQVVANPPQVRRALPVDE